MAKGDFSLRPKIEIDGTELSHEFEAVLESVVVEDHLHTPDMFTLTFRDTAKDLVKKANVDIGSKVKISALPLGGSTPELLVSGEVTGLQGGYGAVGSFAVVRGYDGSQRLHNGRVTQSYANVKDSDIATTVAKRNNLEPGNIEDSKTVHEYVAQPNMSDWDFLQWRAALIGFEVSVGDGKLNFKKPTSSSDAPGAGDFHTGNPLQLAYGSTLLEFHPRVSSAEQVKEVKNRSWDPKTKQAIIGSASAGASSAALSMTPTSLAEKNGNPTYTTVNRPVSSQAEADAIADAHKEHIGSAAVEAEGIARGNPKLKAGVAVSVAQVAEPFNGSYTLTQTRHVFDTQGYRTYFIVSGRQNRSLLGLVSASSNGGAGSGQPIYGVVIGIVTNNDDPEKLARVKLKFPWLSADLESDWARLAQLGAGSGVGAVFIPQVDDEVLVAFEFGDMRRPYVVGSLYNGKDKPKLGDALFSGGKVKRSGFVSRKGHQLLFFDDDGKSGIALISSNNKVRVSLKETGPEIHIYCEGKVTIESQGDMKITSKAGVSIEAGGQLEMKGSSGVKLSSDSSVDVSGTPIKLN